MTKNLYKSGVVAVSLVALVMLATATGSSNSPTPTYTKDVAPILFTNCVDCHPAGAIAPMSLMSYQETRPWAKSIRERVLDKTMPPWSASPAHGKWANDPSLSHATAARTSLAKSGVVTVAGPASEPAPRSSSRSTAIPRRPSVSATW